MKRIIHYIVIFLFVAVLWTPLLCTSRWCESERAALNNAERRDPGGTLYLQDCDYNVEQWVAEVQHWYNDSFAFRSRFLTLYNAVHYWTHSYPEEIYGKDGHMIRRKGILRRLRPLSAGKKNLIQKNLETLRSVCDRTQTPCLFIPIPAKNSVHPELTPRWVRERGSGPKQKELLDLISTTGFPVLDITPALRWAAADTGKIFFNKFDHHWNYWGALVGYYEMIPAIQRFIPDARAIPEEKYRLGIDDSRQFSRRFYMDRLYEELVPTIEQIALPPVKITNKGKEKNVSVYHVYRRGQTDVYCPDAGDQTVLFIRDSFLTPASPFLNHSFGHTIYLNCAVEGYDPAKVVEAHRPDLLVIVMHEILMEQYFAKEMEAHL